MIKPAILLLTIFFSNLLFCSKEFTFIPVYQDSLQQLLDDEKTLKLDAISLPTKIIEREGIKQKILLKKVSSLKTALITQESSRQQAQAVDLISIDSLMQEIELQNTRLSPQECATVVVRDCNKFDQYLKLNAQYLKYHEDHPSDDPNKPMVRSKPDANFTSKPMPRDIAAVFVSLKMQQKIDAQRKW